MSTWPRDSHHAAAYVTPAGADWLASASACPRSVHALWAQCPSVPVTLPCGTAFDVVSMDALFGRRVVSRLWTDGPGTGPVATQRDRVMLFAAPGAARRLGALLGWEEWAATAPPLLCYGWGDAVTVPPPYPQETPAPASTGRWLVAPDVRRPWLPGPEALLWACVRAARAASQLLGRTPVTSAPAVFPG
ncbi:bifunctional DNA primase/polymerase [Streptomyces sparsogenes]|uniref:bifunctional DNA primase/polymerase n=1 Tax=Streptomyces sparsogenes TaxID=67365 RepID=UPI0033C6EEB4